MSRQHHLTNRHSETRGCHAVCDDRELSAVPALVTSEPKSGPFARGQETDSPHLASRKAESPRAGTAPGGVTGGCRPPDPESGSSTYLDKSPPPLFQSQHPSEPHGTALTATFIGTCCVLHCTLLDARATGTTRGPEPRASDSAPCTVSTPTGGPGQLGSLSPSRESSRGAEAVPPRAPKRSHARAAAPRGSPPTGSDRLREERQGRPRSTSPSSDHLIVFRSESQRDSPRAKAKTVQASPAQGEAGRASRPSPALPCENAGSAFETRLVSSSVTGFLRRLLTDGDAIVAMSFAMGRSRCHGRHASSGLLFVWFTTEGSKRRNVKVLGSQSAEFICVVFCSYAGRGLRPGKLSERSRSFPPATFMVRSAACNISGGVIHRQDHACSPVTLETITERQFPPCPMPSLPSACHMLHFYVEIGLF